jgi:hypothetical protein
VGASARLIAARPDDIVRIAPIPAFFPQAALDRGVATDDRDAHLSHLRRVDDR